MPTNSSQASDVFDVEDLIIKLRPIVFKAVRYACRIHHINRDEIEDLCQDAFVLLIEDDYRRLRSFANRSKIETWLHTVVSHHAGLYLWKRRRERENMSLDDLSPDALICPATQEKMLGNEDDWRVLQAIISNLPDRKWRLMELAFQELKPAEMAKKMGIKVSSVSSEKSVLFKEIRKLLKGR